MKGNKLITLSIITSSLLFLSGCNEFGNGEYPSSNSYNDTYISNDTNTEDLESITVDGFTTISPIYITGITETENDTITVYVYDENGNLVETLIATIDENGNWISTTSKLDNGDYTFKVVDKNSNEIKDTITLSTYIKINNIQDITKFPYVISGFTSLYNGSNILYPSDLRLEVVKIEKGKPTIINNNGVIENTHYDDIKTTVEVFENIKPSSTGNWAQMIVGNGGYNNLEETSTHYSSQYYVVVNTEDEVQDDIYFSNSQYSYSNNFNVNLEEVEVVTEIQIIKEIQYIDSNSTLDLSIRGNSTTGTIISGSVSDNITSMIIEVRDNQDTLVDSQTPTINQDFTWENNSINLSDGTYSYKILLNKTDGGEVVINGGFDVDNTLFVSVNQINNQTNGTFNINGSVSLDMTSIVVSIVDSDTNTLVTTIGATSVNDTYEVTTNNLADGNYEVYTTVQDDIGNSKVSNIASFNINSQVVTTTPSSIQCLGGTKGDLTNDGYLIIDNYDLANVENGITGNDGIVYYSHQLCTSNIYNLYGFLKDNSTFNGDMSQWDTSHVTDMRYAFQNSSYNRDISSWDTSSVETMKYSFSGSKFNKPIENWDVSNVTNMEGMFYKSYFNQPLNNWNMSNVTNILGMFASSQFNQPLNNWDVSSVTLISVIFANSQFNSDIDGWDLSSMTYGSSAGSSSFDGLSTVGMANLFYNSDFNQPIGNWNVSNSKNMSGLFNNSIFNQDINNWDVSNVTDMSLMFVDSQLNNSLNNWDVSNVTNMDRMFYNSNFNGNIVDWDVSYVTNMSNMFSNSPFNKGIGYWDTSSVTNMRGMFSNTIFNQALGGWDVSNVTNMYGMFYNNSEFNWDVSMWDVSSVTDHTYYDYGTTSWEAINKPIW